MAITGGVGAAVFLAGRLLFGGLLAAQAADNFRHVDELAEEVAARGLPAARAGVVGMSVALLLGGLGIAVGAYPAVASAVVAGFFAVATPVMHDFWRAPPDERRMERNAFVENLELLGAALVFYALSGQSWAYALNVGL